MSGRPALDVVGLHLRQPVERAGGVMTTDRKWTCLAPS